MLAVILMEIENEGNLGAICRVMANFGFKNLILVNPKCNVNSIETIKRAKHSKEVLNNIKIFDKLKEATKDFDYIIATTAKLGNDYNIQRSPISPEQLRLKLSEIDIKNSNIGLIIGREGDGLTNNEIRQSDFIVSIPASKEYPTLNISHAVGVILYELSKTFLTDKHTEKFIPASKDDQNMILRLIDNKLENLDFSTEEKKETQRKVWKRLLGKSFLTRREAYALIGFLKKL